MVLCCLLVLCVYVTLCLLSVEFLMFSGFAGLVRIGGDCMVGWLVGFAWCVCVACLLVWFICCLHVCVFENLCLFVCVSMLLSLHGVLCGAQAFAQPRANPSKL